MVFFYICSYILFFVLLRGGKCDTIVDSTCDFFNIGNWSLNITCKYSICYALGFELGLTARGSDADRFGLVCSMNLAIFFLGI